MQEDFLKYDALLTTVEENFAKVVEKLYTRENVSVVSEVKEVYLSQNSKKLEVCLIVIFYQFGLPNNL